MSRFVPGRSACVAAVLAVTAMVLVSAGTVSARPAHPSAHKANTITIGMAGIPPFFYTVRTYLAADPQFGFYKKAGVDVVVKPFATGVDAARAVVAGQIDASWSDSGLVMTLVSQGVPVVGIEGMDKVDWVVGAKDASIKSCIDLKGKTVAVEAIGSARYHALQSMLSGCKLTVADVKVVALPTAALQALLAGQIDASVLHLNDIAQAKELGTPVNIVTSIDKTDPYQHYNLLVVRRDNLAAKRADFIKVIRGDILASRFMYEPRNLNAVAQFATLTGSDVGVAKTALIEFLKLKWWPLNQSGLGSGHIIRTIGKNVQLGNIQQSAAPTYKQVVDNSLWKAAWKPFAPKPAPKKK
jgi:NitT/TauT family transport system substrate-binding protein